MPLSCAVCHQGFSRQEHLTRHFRKHTREKPYKCLHCEKHFSRLDVLTRHKASHEQQNNIPTSPVSSRACKRCALDRVRCSRSIPCKRCIDRGLSCCYPLRSNRSPRSRDNVSPRHEPTEPMDVFSSGLVTTDDTADNTICLVPAIAGNSMPPAPSNLANNSSDPPNTFPDIWTDSLDQFTGFGDIDLPNLGPSGINWISPGYEYDITSNLMPGNSELTSRAYPLNEQPSGVPVAVETQVTSPSSPSSAITQNSGIHHSVELRQIINGVYYVDCDGPRAPFGGRYQGRDSRANGRARSAIAPVTLGDQEQSSELSNICSMETYSDLVKNSIQEPQCNLLNIGGAQFPSYAQLELCVQAYFDWFNPTFPFLRRVSFKDSESRHWLLLIAVAAMGSKYADIPEVSSEYLFTILDAALVRCRTNGANQSLHESDDDLHLPGQRERAGEGANLQILQASILHFMCLLYSGRRSSHHKALMLRSYLVETCVSLRLLESANGDETIQDNGTAEGAMHKWLHCESGIRTGMMIWFIDTAMIYEFGLRPQMALDDLKARLPSRDDIWEGSVHINQDMTGCSAVTMAEALEALYIEKRMPAKLSDFSVSLLTHAIYRHTKSALLPSTRLDDWVPTAVAERRTATRSAVLQPPWLPSTPKASKFRNSACDSLDILHWHANSKIAKYSGFEHNTILNLHLARIVILTPTDSLKNLVMTLATSSRESDRTDPETSLNSARRELSQWVLRDRFKARLAVIHCAALYWHIRRYSCDGTQEPYAIYIATLVLWGFCVAMQLPGVAEALSTDSEQDPDPTFCHLDRPLDDELVQLFVRVGHRMCPNISKVGNILDPAAAPKILAEGRDLLTARLLQTSLGSDPHTDNSRRPTWGIARSYARLLDSVLALTMQNCTGPANSQLESVNCNFSLF